MVYFCEKSGVRIVAPGVAVSAGGDVPEWSAPPVATAESDATPVNVLAESDATPPPPVADEAHPPLATTRPRKTR